MMRYGSQKKNWPRIVRKILGEQSSSVMEQGNSNSQKGEAGIDKLLTKVPCAETEDNVTNALESSSSCRNGPIGGLTGAWKNNLGLIDNHQQADPTNALVEVFAVVHGSYTPRN